MCSDHEYEWYETIYRLFFKSKIGRIDNTHCFESLPRTLKYALIVSSIIIIENVFAILSHFLHLPTCRYYSNMTFEWHLSNVMCSSSARPRCLLYMSAYNERIENLFSTTQNVQGIFEVDGHWSVGQRFSDVAHLVNKHLLQFRATCEIVKINIDAEKKRRSRKASSKEE